MIFEDFERQFERLKPIVIKAMRGIRIKLWDYDDYVQEGRIILFEVLKAGCSEEKLHVYFKVRYRQRLIDELRSTKVQKRMINSLPLTLNVYEHADFLNGNYATPEQEMIYTNLTQEIAERLTPKYQQLLYSQLQGEKLARMDKSRMKQKVKAVLYQYN